MNETTPKYILELEERLGNKIDKLGIEIVSTTSKAFTAVQKQINSLEIRFDDLEDKVDNNIANTIAIRKDTDKILKHIGTYEIRAKNIEQILLKDHKPRIVDLEKEVFS